MADLRASERALVDLRVMDSIFHKRRAKASREFTVDALLIINHMDNQEQPGTKRPKSDPQAAQDIVRSVPSFSPRWRARRYTVTNLSRLP